jgi:hypothetical protein
MSTTTGGLRIGGGSRQLAIWAVLAAAIVSVVITAALVVGRPESTVAPAGGSAAIVPGWSGWTNSSARLHQEINRKIAAINRQGSSNTVPVCEPCVERYQ